MDLLSQVIGLKLDAARMVLAGSTPGQAMRIVETCAPPRKNATYTFGEWRVLRAQYLEAHNKQPILELTVARELLEHARPES